MRPWANFGDTRLPERFWAKVQPCPMSGCWLWSAAQTSTSYGGISHRGRYTPAHRVAYEVLVGAIPGGLQIDHLCCVKWCVNPLHLEPVTQRENLLRGPTIPAANARKTHCPRGHEYTAENTRTNSLRQRRCRTCDRLRHRVAWTGW